jgi:hypothetical protein
MNDRTRDDLGDSVDHSVSVSLPIERAFTLFTCAIGRWWPAANTFARDDAVEVVIEPAAGGRWFERTLDGREQAWGRVVAWSPPDRVTLTWQITAQGTPEPDPDKASTVDVRFTALGPAETRVDLTHSAFARHGAEDAAIWREAMASEGGWPLFLARYAAAAESTPQG